MEESDDREMYEIAICDDYQVYVAELTALINELSAELGIETNIDTYKSFSALDEEMNKKHYNMLILETVIGGENGIEYAKTQRQNKCEADILFVSARVEYALPAYSVFPVGFIQKPIQKKKFRLFFRHAMAKHVKKQTVNLKSSDGGTYTVDTDDLLYIEVIGNELDVYLKKEKLDCTGSLCEIYGQLSKKQFYRSHRSFIVNLKYVTKITKFQFVMENGNKVTIAKNRYAQAKKVFSDYNGI